MFMFASMLCGLATTLSQIVVFRILQGLAGASMMPMSMAALLDLWPRRYTAHVMAIWSAVVTAAPVIGPTLGGYLTDTMSWRWAFFINVPLDIIGFAIVYIALPSDEGGRQRQFDYLGFAGIVMFAAGVQLVLDRGPTLDWFDSREIWIEATIAALGLYLFVVQTMTHKQPYFPLAIFKDRNFVTCNLFGMLIATSLFTTSALVPAMLQNLMGYSAMQSGMAAIPRGFGSVLAFFIAPFLAPVLGARWTISIGIIINGVALWYMGHFDLSMTVRPVEITGFLQGFGSALMFNPMSVISYSTLRAEFRNEAAVLSNMLRSVGGSFGIGIYAAIFTTQTASTRGHLVSHVDPVSAVLNWRMPDLITDAGSGLAMLNAEVNRQAAMIGYNTVFGYMCLTSLLLPPLLFLMRPSRTTDSDLPRDIDVH